MSSSSSSILAIFIFRVQVRVRVCNPAFDCIGFNLSENTKNPNTTVPAHNQLHFLAFTTRSCLRSLEKTAFRVYLSFKRVLARPSITTGLEARRDFTNDVTNAGGQQSWFVNNVDCTQNTSEFAE